METTWDESLETGNELIDTQHRAVLSLVDELKAVEMESHDASRVREVLGKVMDFTLEHFASEEELMVQVSYPPEPTAEMIVQHQDFKAYARLRVLEFRREAVQSVLPLQSFLQEWLIVHEFGLDRDLAEFIRAHPVPPATRT